MEFPKNLIVSVSGIRGRVGIDLTPDVVAGFASAFGSYVRERGWGSDLIIARDSRPSGPAFAAAAAAGLRAVGCRVSDLGLVPTPTALLHIEDRHLSGGIVVTASHNPKEWNALKLASPEGAFLTPDEGSAFIAGLQGGRAPDYNGWGDFGEIEDVPGTVDRHIARIRELDLIDPDAIAARRFKVAIDCIRGAGGVILPGLLEGLGCEVVGIGLEPDGRFNREPEPVPQNLGELGDLVRREKADLGMAVDPDVDRLALVDGDGLPIGEEYTLALAVQLTISRSPGPVVANLSTSQVVEEACRRAGGEYYQSPVGEANVVAAMRERQAVVGGEGSGGVVLPALHFTRDAPLAAALTLQLLAETDGSLGEIVAGYPQLRIIKDRVARPEVELSQVFSEIVETLSGAAVDRHDGLHLRWPDREMWLHVRSSGTEPILRFIAEGPSSELPEIHRLIEVAKKVIERRTESSVHRAGDVELGGQSRR